MKFLLLAWLIFILAGCAERIIPIGTTEAEFLRHNRSAIQVEASTARTVYKKVDYGFGHPPSVKFFYFKKGLLYNIDTGVSRPDVVIHNY